MRLIILCLIFVKFLKKCGNCCEIIDCNSIDSDCVIDPDYWLDNDNFNLLAGCPDSYFKLDFEFSQNNINDDTNYNYKLTIDDPQLEIENETLTQDIHVNTLGDELDITIIESSTFSNVSVPFSIKYAEIPMTSTILHNLIFTNASIESEIQPNSNIKYKLSGYDQLQYYDLSWKLNDGLGFVAMENGNGRITLFTNPVMENFKVQSH